MEKISSEKTKPKTKRIHFNLSTLQTERVPMEGDSNGCVLVIPEIFRMNDRTTLYQEGLPEHCL